mmetsp:Transcript_20795/g.53624  ORF Transcript_20795/g.53624 Transcript_20795/m.53624 type:complete len:105 (-) Transcript_20795:1274-1588(-)
MHIIVRRQPTLRAFFNVYSPTFLYNNHTGNEWKGCSSYSPSSFHVRRYLLCLASIVAENAPPRFFTHHYSTQYTTNLPHSGSLYLTPILRRKESRAGRSTARSS